MNRALSADVQVNSGAVSMHVWNDRLFSDREIVISSRVSKAYADSDPTVVVSFKAEDGEARGYATFSMTQEQARNFGRRLMKLADENPEPAAS